MFGDIGDVSTPIHKDFGLYCQGAIIDPGQPPSPRAFATNGKYEVLRVADSRAALEVGAMTLPTFYRCAHRTEWNKVLRILQRPLLDLYGNILDIENGNSIELNNILFGDPKKAKKADKSFMTKNVVPEERFISYWFNDEQVTDAQTHLSLIHI